MLRFTGDVEGAFKSYRKYLNTVEALSQQNPRHRRPFAIALDIVATAHKKIGKLEEARSYYDRSLDFRKGVLAEQIGRAHV